MASIRTRTRKNGAQSHQVLWRNPTTGQQEAWTAPDESTAHVMVSLLNSNGHNFADAARTLQLHAAEGDTVQEHLLKHIANLTSAGPDTIKRYKRAVVNHFSSDLGKIPVRAVEHIDVVRWVQGMTAKGLSAKTIANHHGFLSGAMTFAIRNRIRADNPCDGVKLPKATHTADTMHILTPKAARQIIEAHPDRYQLLVECLLVTGARFGEATAFFPEDFDLDATVPVVRVDRAWKRDENDRFYLGPPKTRKSRRAISLPPRFVEKVRPLIESTPPDIHVFRTTYDGPIRHSTFWQFWDDALVSLNYSKTNRPRIHDLRHTHASLMLAGGMNIYELSRRLGHESIQTTIDRYSHLIPDAHFRAAEIAQQALEG